MDNTIIVLTSDNGYHLGEKDCIQKWHLWGESTRVPMMIHVPGVTDSGGDCDHPVSHIDLYPILIRIALTDTALFPFLNLPDREDGQAHPSR